MKGSSKSNITFIMWGTSPFIRADRYSDDLFDGTTLLYPLLWRGDLHCWPLVTEANSVLFLSKFRVCYSCQTAKVFSKFHAEVCLLFSKHPDMLNYSLWCQCISCIYISLLWLFEFMIENPLNNGESKHWHIILIAIEIK